MSKRTIEPTKTLADIHDLVLGSEQLGYRDVTVTIRVNGQGKILDATISATH